MTKESLALKMVKSSIAHPLSNLIRGVDIVGDRLYIVFWRELGKSEFDAKKDGYIEKMRDFYVKNKDEFKNLNFAPKNIEAKINDEKNLKSSVIVALKTELQIR